MSIWCSWEPIGYDKDSDLPQPHGGEVRSYAVGFSNHYPNRDGTYEQPAHVGLSTIPVWCVPGHRGEESALDHRVGEWTRLDVYTAEHSFKDGGKPTGVYDVASVVLDEAAARALAADLIAWADSPKALVVHDGDRL